MSVDLGYSETDLAADLRTWWDEQVNLDNDPFADPSPPRVGTIFEVLPVVDSLGVVTGLLTVEGHINMKAPPRLIKRGGYRNVEEMVGDLLPKVRAYVLGQRKQEAA